MIDLAIGLATAIGSAAAFGSFGVPIKCRRILDAKVDPLAYQCYKSLVCFLTSWLVLTYNHFRFTWWGTVGASIWVVNGVCAIIAIQKAGLGITQTTWSALSIFVSFIWGAFVFHEPIKSLPLSFVGLILMAIGMAGLGFAARQVAPVVIVSNLSVKPLQSTDGATRDCENCQPKTIEEFERVPSADSQEVDTAAMALAENDQARAKALIASNKKDFIIGVALACWIGLTNGSFLVPLKYAQKDIKGIIYVLSFGIGAALVTLDFYGALGIS
ncbi:g1289 [Coccomyxa elongata]